MAAMPEEIYGVIQLLSNKIEKTIAGRIYYCGNIHSIPVVIVFSRWGKVAAASTVTSLIHEFNITSLLFTGVAGAIDPRLSIGDIVIAESLIQHDMDARPLMKRHEIPLLGKSWFKTDPFYSDKIKMAIASSLAKLISSPAFQQFKLTQPEVYYGEIASGDQFFATDQQRADLQEILPEVLCVEMEGAAVAQVCFEHDMPFAIVRTISDIAGSKSEIDFPLFIEKIASNYSVNIIDSLFEEISHSEK